MEEPKLRMPAEWESQAAIWCIWPDNTETWPENLEAAQIEFAAMVHALAEFTQVLVMVNAASRQAAEQRLLRSHVRHLQLIDIPSNDAWARDCAPTFVVDQETRKRVALDWRFNSWGEKYPPYELDQQVAQKVAEGLKCERIEPGPCFEGGAIEVNGQGLLISTQTCASDSRRNPEISPEQRLLMFENVFQQYLGITQTVWLPGNAILGDDTDGHVDQLVRFTDESTIVYAWTEDLNDPQHQSLKQNRLELERSLERLNLDVTFYPLQLPKPFSLYGRQIPGSYCNFVISNEVVVVPQFGVPEDKGAVDLLTDLFSEHHVLGLPSRNLSVGLGSFHCLTQQVPYVEADG